MKKVVANLAKMPRRPVEFAGEAIERFKQLVNNASLDAGDLVPGRSPVGCVA